MGASAVDCILRKTGPGIIPKGRLGEMRDFFVAFFSIFGDLFDML